MRTPSCCSLAVLLAAASAACSPAVEGRLPSTRAVDMLLKSGQLLEKGETCSAILLLVEVRETAEDSEDRARASSRLLEANQGDESLPLLASCGVRSRVLSLMDTARSGEAEQVTLYFRSTVGWGCPCAPFVFSDSGDVATFDEELVYPVFRDARDFDRAWEPHGTYVLTGRMDSVPLDYYNWSKLIGRPQPLGKGDGEEHRLKRHPVFHVDSWCFAPDDGEGGSSAPDARAGVIDTAHVCPHGTPTSEP